MLEYLKHLFKGSSVGVKGKSIGQLAIFGDILQLHMLLLLTHSPVGELPGLPGYTLVTFSYGRLLTSLSVHVLLSIANNC